MLSYNPPRHPATAGHEAARQAVNLSDDLRRQTPWILLPLTMSTPTRAATADDAPELVRVINRAFACEKTIISSDRIDRAHVLEHLRNGEFLVVERNGAIAACVYVEPRGERAYFGLLSVDPAYQRDGLGRLLVRAAEQRAIEFGALHMDINVVNLRTELPPIYRKLGYRETGVAQLNPEVATLQPCHLIRMSKPLVFRTAILGYGLAGKTFHAPFIQRVKSLRLDAVMSSDGAKVLADLPAVAIAPDADAVFANPEIDLVVIATPTATHFDIARRALEAGKHVVVDKPVTVTVAEAEALIELAGRARRVLSVFQSRRWDDDFVTLRETIASGRLGEVVYFESHYDRYRPEVRHRWKEQPGSGGGIWLDLGPHLIDQALQLFGFPDSVYGDIGMQRPGSEAVDYFHVLLRYGRRRVVLHGSNLVPDADTRFLVHGTLASCRTAPAPDGDYVGFYDALAACLRGEGPNPVPAEEALGVMRVIEAASRSSEASRQVFFEKR
jgi:predicted dehydrogenase/GNAT superfamily N-acetyltransferase